MTVHSALPDVRPFTPAIGDIGTEYPDAVSKANGKDEATSARGNGSGDGVATGPWPGLPPMSAPIERVGDCKFGIGPQDRDRWTRSVPRNPLLCSMSLNQHSHVQTYGWRAVVKAGKPLPECAKWNGTLQNLDPKGKRPGRVRLSLADSVTEEHP